ncbi:OPT oligopeptide transporter [Mycena galericulata]|nr:OPT oligopeptide transporter [Mycena galericulata]
MVEEEKPESESSCPTESDESEYANIPQLVRDLVDFEDEPTMPTLTFRVIILATIFVCLGAFTGAIPFYRTTSASFSIFFIVLMSWPLGKMMERVLPDHRVPLGPFSFSLNPGPFSASEHVLIGIAGNAGSMGNWARAASIIGFSFAAFVRQILIYDPNFIFPVSLQQVTLYRSIHKSSDADSKRQMRGFWYICSAIFVWQFIFPMTAALAPVCWIGGKNKAANFVGSGIGGMGVLNFTLNVSNITSSVITQPFFVQAILFTGFLITMWILIPITYFGNIWGSPTFNVMSNSVYVSTTRSTGFRSFDPNSRFTKNGTYAGAQYLWCIFFAYAAFISAFVWMALFAGPQILAAVKSLFTGKRVHHDRLSNIMKRYPEVPATAWMAMFTVAFLVLLIIVLKGHIYMPLFTLFVALAIGAVSTLPMSLVYAISGYRVDVGYFNELVYGYMLQAPGSSPHPLGQLAYRIISGNVWYDVQYLIEDQKIAHYMHVPPRDVIICQLFGSSVGLADATMLWVLATRLDYMRGTKVDPNGQWTGQDLKSYNTAGIQYALVGPHRLFADARYKPLWYGFAVGAVAPLIVWLLHRRFKKTKFELWNTTIFFSNMSKYRGNISTGPLTQFILGFIWNFWLFRYRYAFWKMWAYITGAALPVSGYCHSPTFLTKKFSAAGATMPAWWGNNAISVERCFGKGQ